MKFDILELKLVVLHVLISAEQYNIVTILNFRSKMSLVENTSVENTDVEKTNVKKTNVEKTNVENGPGSKCFFCCEPCSELCCHCKLISYCCDQHFSIHRPENFCFPFRVETSDSVGRYVVAARDIKPTGKVTQH